MAYTRVNWEDLPSTDTPINATNLNKMDKGIYDNDQAIATKATLSDIEDKLVNVSNEVDEDYRVNLLKGNDILPPGTIYTLTSGSIVLNFEVPKANTQYTMKTNLPATGGSALVFFASGANAEVDSVTNGVWEGSPKTMTSDANKYVTIAFRYLSSYANIKLSDYWFTLVEGTTAQDPVPGKILVDDIKYTDTLNVGSVVDSRSRVNVLHSKNLFDKDNWYKSYIDPTNGNITSSNNAALFNYIKVKPSTIYSLKLDTNVLDLKVAYYTNNYTWISSSNTITASTTITIPNNCEYIRIYINVDGNGINQTKIDNLQFMVNEGSTALPYEPYITPSIYVDNEEIYNQNIMNYSTSEQRIGTWIDGKPLYRKVIDFGNLPNTNQKEINHNISNIKNIVNLYGSCTDETFFLPLPTSSTVASSNIALYASNTKIGINAGSDRSSFKGYVVLEYTKTND